MTPAEKNQKLREYVSELADQKNTTECNILYRWCIERGWGVVFTSGDAERLCRIVDIYDLEFTQEEIEKISELGKAWDNQRQFFKEEFRRTERMEWVEKQKNFDWVNYPPPLYDDEGNLLESTV